MAVSAYEMQTTDKPLSPEALTKIDAYWRACNYLAAGMIYLQDNPLLKEPLKPEHIKKPSNPNETLRLIEYRG